MATENDQPPKVLTLTEAAEAGDVDAVRTILARGDDVNEPDQQGSTALLLATWKGHNSIIELLLEKGANAGTIDILGLSALHVACVKGNLKAVKMLLDYGCDANGSSYPRTPPPIHFAVGSNEDIVLLLVNRGADVLNLHGSGDPPLMRAVTNGQNSMVKMMLSAASPDLSFTNHDGDNIFQCMFKNTTRTASKNHCEILETLINYARQDETRLEKAKKELTKAMPCLVRNGCMTCFKKALPLADLRHKYEMCGTDILQIAMTSGSCWSALVVDWTLHDTNTLDDYRLEMAEHLLTAGASLSSTRENVIGRLWNSPSTRTKPVSSQAYVYYIRAWGGWLPQDSDSDAAFQDFALFLMDDLARLVCWAGYVPSKRDLEYLTNTWLKQKTMAEQASRPSTPDSAASDPPSSIANNLITELWTKFALNPRPLTNIAAICVRKCIQDNVLYNVKRSLHLPQRLQDHITLKTITDQMQIHDNENTQRPLIDSSFCRGYLNENDHNASDEHVWMRLLW